MNREQLTPVMRRLAKLVVLTTLVALSILLFHVAHCDSPTGDCNLCKLVASFVLPIVAGLILFLRGGGRFTPIGSAALPLSVSCGVGPVRAPPAHS